MHQCRRRNDGSVLWRDFRFGFQHSGYFILENPYASGKAYNDHDDAGNRVPAIGATRRYPVKQTA